MSTYQECISDPLFVRTLEQGNFEATLPIKWNGSVDETVFLLVIPLPRLAVSTMADGYAYLG